MDVASPPKTKWSLIGFYLGLLIVFEALALYSIRKYHDPKSNKALYLSIAALVYGIVCVYLLITLVSFEGVGIVNFLWNVFSTLAGFLIGVYMFSESPTSMQWAGVVLGTLAFGLIVLGDKKK